VLDAYEQVIKENPNLRPGTLAVEQAFLADEAVRQRAIQLGVSVTVQHPLTYALGAQLLAKRGKERTARAMPIGAWVTDGAQVAAGSNSPPAAPDPLQAIWGMVTRGTRQVGVQGLKYAVDRLTAFQLYTLGSARFYWEDDRRGTLQPGRLADLVAYRGDPLTRPIDDLLKLRPMLTMVGAAPYSIPT